MADTPLVSFILATCNRLPTLLRTLQRVEACGLPRSQFEIWVVDNASTDTTADTLQRRRPEVNLLPLERNRGSCAKSLAAQHAAGEYVFFLDDDSYPLEGTVQRMLHHFREDDALGAAGCVIHLQDGSKECSAMPHVFVGCGVGFRRSVLKHVGGLDPSFFMQAEEYDLSFRLVQAGYKVETFDDLHVLHLKSNEGRVPTRTHFYDMRNNLTLAACYLPAPLHRAYMRDWRQRYAWLAEDRDAEDESLWGFCCGWLRGYCRRLTRPAARLGAEELELFFGFETIRSTLAVLQRDGLTRVLFAGLGKNIYAYFQAAVQLKLQVQGVLDDRFSDHRRRYRGLAILPYGEGLRMQADAIVITNDSPVDSELIECHLRKRTDLPIFLCRRPPQVPFSPPGAGSHVFVPSGSTPGSF